MNIKIHSSELNRMMKTITQCIDSKDMNMGNVEIISGNNLLSIRASNGFLSAVMSTAMLGGDDESFCVDGALFAKVCAMNNGEINISTDGRTCTIKGTGRTRLPIVTAKVPEFKPVSGKKCAIRAESFAKGYGSVAYAISTDQSRVVLTGVLLEAEASEMRMVAIDGFRLSVESVPCESEQIKAIVPGAFMKLVSSSTIAGESITLSTDGKRIQALTDGMTVACTLLSGDFPDYSRIVPDNFKTNSVLYADALQNALKCGSVVNGNNNLIKLEVAENDVTVSSNSEQANFDETVPCITNGSDVQIAFNHKYLMETIASITENEITMSFNSSINPCVIRGKEGTGYRLILPVRVAR